MLTGRKWLRKLARILGLKVPQTSKPRAFLNRHGQIISAHALIKKKILQESETKLEQDFLPVVRHAMVCHGLLAEMYYARIKPVSGKDNSYALDIELAPDLILEPEQKKELEKLIRSTARDGLQADIDSIHWHGKSFFSQTRIA